MSDEIRCDLDRLREARNALDQLERSMTSDTAEMLRGLSDPSFHDSQRLIEQYGCAVVSRGVLRELVYILDTAESDLRKHRRKKERSTSHDIRCDLRSLTEALKAITEILTPAPECTPQEIRAFQVRWLDMGRPMLIAPCDWFQELQQDLAAATAELRHHRSKDQDPQ